VAGLQPGAFEFTLAVAVAGLQTGSFEFAVSRFAIMRPRAYPAVFHFLNFHGR
jgi:hypothetical protein